MYTMGSNRWKPHAVADGWELGPATFYGESVALRYLASANRGIAEVTLDGVLLADLDQYSASSESRIFRWGGLAPGMHTLTITVSGRKNASATNNIVGVTTFVVGR